jgi:hypothetical protein
VRNREQGGVEALLSIPLHRISALDDDEQPSQ